MIQVSAAGAFNDEGTRQYCDAIEVEVRKLDGAPYVIAVNLTQFEGATPGSWDLLEQHNQFLATTAIVAKAVIAEQAMIRSYAKTANETVLKGKTRLFARQEDALTWLSEMLSQQAPDQV